MKRLLLCVIAISLCLSAGTAGAWEFEPDPVSMSVELPCKSMCLNCVGEWMVTWKMKTCESTVPPIRYDEYGRMIPHVTLEYHCEWVEYKGERRGFESFEEAQNFVDEKQTQGHWFMERTFDFHIWFLMQKVTEPKTEYSGTQYFPFVSGVTKSLKEDTE